MGPHLVLLITYVAASAEFCSAPYFRPVLGLPRVRIGHPNMSEEPERPDSFGLQPRTTPHKYHSIRNGHSDIRHESLFM